MDEKKYDEIENRVRKIENGVAKLEGSLASSWALHTKDEYENGFKDKVKNDIMNYVVKIVISAMVLLGGAGYVYVKSTMVDVYRTENKQIIDDLKARYESSINNNRLLFDWQRYHNYAKNYLYLAELYSKSNIDEKTKREKIKECLMRAKTYFDYALNSNPKQGSSYFELGEIYCNYSYKYNIKECYDIDKSLNYYCQSSKNYTDAEIAQGWRADAYRKIGIIYFDLFKRNSEKIEYLIKAEDYMNKACEEYQNAVPESREYNKNSLNEVNDYLVSIRTQRK